MSSSKRKRQQLRLQQAQAQEEASSSQTPPGWKKYGLDLDSLECPICTEPFAPPVFQCDNGHTVCSTCVQRLRVCHSCPLPIGRIRCLGVEKVIESLWVECEHGCPTPLRFHEREEHERSVCEYRPIQCPMERCSHADRMFTFSEHLMKEHKMPTVQLSEATQSQRFDMGETEAMAVLVKDKDAWLVVSLLPQRKGYKFIWVSVWALKELVIKMCVKPFLTQHLHSTEYSLVSALAHGEEEKYLFVPGQEDQFEVIVSVVGGR